MRLTAQEVYEKLVNEDRILEEEGKITFEFGNVNIIVKQKDVVGNIIQEWVQGWLDKNEIEYAPSENTQMPPDFFLNPDDLTQNLLEVKAFNRSASPGFDIADFRAYQKEIIEKPYMLHVDYLIFGYDMSDDGKVTIKDVWLKKVWEITRRMEDWPINLQIKEGHVHKIRPGVWYGNETSRTDYLIFRSLEDFVSAIEETCYKNTETHNDAANWKRHFINSYRNFYGISLDIPRWMDIEDTYDEKKRRKKQKAEQALQKAIETYEKQQEKCRIAEEKYNLALANGSESKIQKTDESLRKANERLANYENKVSEKRAIFEALP